MYENRRGNHNCRAPFNRNFNIVFKHCSLNFAMLTKTFVVSRMNQSEFGRINVKTIILVIPIL